MLHFIFILNLIIFTRASAVNCPGCTPLDGLTFDKLIGKFSASLVKIDQAYPYGDKHEEFAKVAKEASAIDNLFVGEVGVKDYGDKDNEELAKRFNVVKDEFPVAFVFVNNGGDVKHYRFDEEFKAENLKDFLKKKSGIYLPLAGCIGEFDELAAKFIEASADKENIITEAESKVKGFNEKQTKQAEVYVKIMKKIYEKGSDFVSTEESRLKKVISGKLSKEKKQEIEGKLNILKSFVSGPVKTEL